MTFTYDENEEISQGCEGLINSSCIFHRIYSANDRIRKSHSAISMISMRSCQSVVATEDDDILDSSFADTKV